MKKNLIPISSIYVSPEDDARIREPENLAKSVTERSKSIMRFGQLQAILVEELVKPIDGKKWKLIDGQVRMVAIQALSLRIDMLKDEEVSDAFEKWDMLPGHIEVTTRDSLSPTMSLMMEYHANVDRDDFTWDEKASYFRRIHDMLQKEHGRKNWPAKSSAEYLQVSEATISQYLQLTDVNEPATGDERVKKATTKGAALRQLNIAKERDKRKRKVKKVAESKDTRDYALAASLSVFKGDCREWIKKIPDGSLDWFHWDPPWGGDEGDGGAYAAHKGIETAHDYALDLMLGMLPEIWRVLSEGSWIALWYTPVHYNWVRLALQGHRFNSKSGNCEYCKKHILRDHIWFTDNYQCLKSPIRFWVNPYPMIWRKTDRTADGHEIQRFLTKETEYFLIAGKVIENLPVLLRSDRGNVFDYTNIPRLERRHVNHKPKEMLTEILSLISVPGSLGGDAGAGSGSIIEGAYEGGRKIVVAELDESSHVDCLSVAVKNLMERNYGPEAIASWLPKFTG